MLPLIALLALFPLAYAQSSGVITIKNAGSSCIVIAQVANLNSPPVLTSLHPLCPDSGTAALDWPLTSDGDGAASGLAIYGDVNGGSPGCVMAMSQMQAMYLLGRNVEWRGGNQLWDNTASGYISDPSTFQPVSW